jgi:hypothetical protein
MTMEKWDDRYTLKGIQEIYERYFTLEASDKSYKIQKVVRGRKIKSNVMIVPKSISVKSQFNKPRKKL